MTLRSMSDIARKRETEIQALKEHIKKLEVVAEYSSAELSTLTAERDALRKKLLIADQFISILRNSGDDEDEYWAQRFYNALDGVK